jgi:two-component system sensor histidine kinase HydH
MSTALAPQELPTARQRDRSPQGRLLRGYLHKTSNSLCGIKGYASLIADESMKTRSATYWARKIINEVERMEAIFRSVGDLTGSGQGPDLETDLAHFTAEVIRQCERAFPDLEIYSRSLPSGRLLLPAVDLALVLQEVLKNSAEAAAANGVKGRVEIFGETTPAGRIALTIRDFGPGIPAKLLDQVCDPFVTTKPGHLGIGLARVETLVEMHGLAWALSSNPGQGTTITLETAVLKDQGSLASAMDER